MSNFLLGFATILALLIVFIVLEARLKKSLNKEFTRKIAHILTGLVSIGLSLVLTRANFIILSLLGTVVIYISFRKSFFTFIHGVKRSTAGEIFLPLGILVAYLLAKNQSVFLTTILILTFADPIAGWLKFKFAKQNFLGNIAFLVTSLVIMSIYFGIKIEILVAAAVLTLVEDISHHGSDNLTIPLFSALLLNFLL